MSECGQVASVGRVVHYVSHGTPPGDDGAQAYTSECRAALVTEVSSDGLVGLFVANPEGVFLHSLACGGVHYDDANAPGTWHWPERREAS